MKKNIIANYIGRFWGVFSNFLFVPLYINFLGLESYSIISFSLVIAGMMAVMDAGLTSTLSREFASSQNSDEERLRIFKTLESTYFIISIVVIFLLLLSSNFLAFKWLNLENISSEKVSLLLKIISVEIGLKLLSNFYVGGLLGLEKQVKANMYQVAYGIIRNGIVLLPILFYPSLETFFTWQATTTLLYIIILRVDIIHVLSEKKSFFFSRPKVEKQIIKKIWRFAGGMMLISMVAGLNTQMDKLALSKLLPIEVLGLYTLAFSLSRGLSVLSSPFSTAILPRMTALFTSKKKEEAVKIFNVGYLIIAIILFSFAASMSLYAKELIWVWTNDIQLAEKASIYLPWLSLGTTFLALQGLPFSVAIANGYTKYNNILGLFSLIITLPGYWILTELYGGIGAASLFSLVQVIIGIIFLYLVNRRFMQLNIGALFFKNYILPIVISCSITYLFIDFINIEDNRLITLAKIGFVVLCSLLANVIILIPKKTCIKGLKKIKT